MTYFKVKYVSLSFGTTSFKNELLLEKPVATFSGFFFDEVRNHLTK